MFTGIITDVGEVASKEGGRFAIVSKYPADSISLGASIACDGCCLTVTECNPRSGGGSLFTVDVSNETLACTTLGDWQAGRRINLERALTLRDELGGHMVSGHVDGVARVLSRKQDGESIRFELACPDDLAKFVAEKGSVALNGVSLTVNEVEGAKFGINLVAHTVRKTNWGDADAGAAVNMEVDLLARYVARIIATQT
jgi:riboflavin synthase